MTITDLQNITKKLLLNAARLEEEIVEDALRYHLRLEDEVRVVIRKPRWMPEWMYRRLMRTIVVEKQALPAVSIVPPKTKEAA